jgi:hypothetical protein
MPRERLIALLEEVDAELEAARAAGALDAETEERLRDLDGDIRSWLDDHEDTREPQELAGPAERAVAQFRAEYPTLTEVLRQIADTLGKMGI